MSVKGDLQSKRRSILERIARKAAEVRKLQKEYFKTRSSGVLYAAQTAERELDVMLADLERTDRQIDGREPVPNSLF